MVHPANEQDRIAGKWLLKRLPFGERLKLFIFDSGYASDALMNWCQQLFGVETQITHRGQEQAFVVQPKRWIVERTLAWLNRFRRLTKDFEQRVDIAEGFVYLAMSHLILRRLTA